MKLWFPILLCLLSCTFVPEIRSQGTVSVLGHKTVPGSVFDIWGYVDGTGTEYALVGSSNGLFIFDADNPSSPVQVASVSGVFSFDIKVWQTYAYVVNGGSGGTGKIIDLTDPANPQLVGSFPQAHNIFIDGQGYLYAECPGLAIYDLNPDPVSPSFVWSDNENDCHDAAVVGDRLFDFHGSGGTKIYDVSDRTNPVLQKALVSPLVTYHHSGWPTADGNHLLICDELSSGNLPDITVWDISDLVNAEIVELYLDPNATVHNLYIISQLALTAYYAAGFRVFDVSNPLDLTLEGTFDPTPGSMPGFSGAFGVYPFSPSGTVYLSDDTGFYALSVNGVTSVEALTESVPHGVELFQNYPNPFNPGTTISFNVENPVVGELAVFNVLGQRVRTLREGPLAAGSHRVFWDGTDGEGRSVGAGVYVCRLVAGTGILQRKMILIK